MKKIVYILGLVVAGFTTSCDDYLEAPAKSSLEEANIFATYDLANGAVMGINQSFGETNSYRGRYLPWYGMNTDVEWYNTCKVVLTRGGEEKSDLTTYNAVSTNGQMNTDNNAWAKMYEGIERANICIRGLRNYGNAEPGTNMGQLLGEALTLRAVYYADLVKTWGDVVARFEPITTETIYMGKSDRDVIYKQLIADLEEAEELVYWPNGNSITSSVERVNKVFVKALRARLCMAAAGYSQRPDGIRRSNDAALSPEVLYPIAYQECKDILAEGYTIDSSFENVFLKLCKDDVTAGSESLWEIPFADGRGRMVYTFGVKHNAKDQYTQQAQGGSAGPLPNVFYDFDVKDLRRDVTCVPYGWNETNKVYDATKSIYYSQQVLTSLNKWYFGKLRYEWMKRVVTATNDDGVNKQYMRMAEVYLIAAECANHLEGADAAIPYLRKIRQRAFPQSEWAEKVETYLTNRKADMFNAIVDENGYEFCGEMIRKESLIRWNLLKSKIDEAKVKMYELRTRTGAYADLPEKIYYKYENKIYGKDTIPEVLKVYGLNHGETDVTAYEGNSEWTPVTWISETKLENDKIEAIYNSNPDAYQFWPIWQVYIDSSNGLLKNDYGY